MTAGDVPAVAALERRVFSLPWARSAFEMAVRLAGVAGYVAEDDRGHLLGYTVASFGAGRMLLANLAVAPEARRRGIGRDLLERALAAGRRRGARLCRLEVRRSNRAAIRLYRQAGFQPAGIRPGYYRRPREDALTMLRLLAPIPRPESRRPGAVPPASRRPPGNR